MIYNSQKWKRELLRNKKRLCILRKIKWTERVFGIYAHKIDLTLLTSAIIVRKLLESDKLSDEADNYSITVTTYVPHRHIDRLHNWVEDGDYEWGDRTIEKVSARTICNSLIHSYAYCPKFSDQYKLMGFLVTSDFDRNKFIYDVELDTWIEYITFIASDSICEQSVFFNEKNCDYKSTIKKRG